MAFQKKNAEFVGYLDIVFSGADIESIMQLSKEPDTALMEIFQYATPLQVEFKVRWNSDRDEWQAILYQNNVKHEWAGIGIRATGDSPEIAIAALAVKITLVGKRDWLTLVRVATTTTHGIS